MGLSARVLWACRAASRCGCSCRRSAASTASSAPSPASPAQAPAPAPAPSPASPPPPLPPPLPPLRLDSVIDLHFCFQRQQNFFLSTVRNLSSLYEDFAGQCPFLEYAVYRRNGRIIAPRSCLPVEIPVNLNLIFLYKQNLTLHIQ